MSIYMTTQRKKLFAFLRENPDKQFTAKQISDQLCDSSISLSAIYRNLALMDEQGLINRIVRENNREVYYQYIHSEECRNCIHLTCIKCGRIFHMNKQISEQMISDVSDVDGFLISKSKTVLYGVCKQCM